MRQYTTTFISSLVKPADLYFFLVLLFDTTPKDLKLSFVRFFNTFSCVFLSVKLVAALVVGGMMPKPAQKLEIVQSHVVVISTSITLQSKQ